MQNRIEELEGALKDIVLGCDMLAPYAKSESERRFISEVRRVASAPFGGQVATAASPLNQRRDVAA